MTDQAAIPPIANLEAEEYVLGALMLSAAAIDAVQATGLDAADFYRESHGRIYHAAQAIHAQGGLADVLTIADRLEQLGQLHTIEGGKDRLRDIATLATAATNAPHHAALVVRTSRLRRVAAQAQRIHEAANAGAQLDDVEASLLDLGRALLDDTTTGLGRYRVTPAGEFLDSFEEQAAALAGSNGETLLPAGGLLILGGEAGSGKTTLALDAVAHLSSGTPWIGYPVDEPVRVLVIENEGPRAQFREKLKAKAASWQGADFLANVHVWEEPWARFSFANPADRRALRETARQHRIDLVMADPLDSLGIQGAGTPEDTRIFVQYLRECGLHNPASPLAFFLLHHFGKQEHGSIVARLRGAWGDHADAVLGLEQTDGHASKLTWGKLRHATPPPKSTTLLLWDLDTRGFTAVDVAEQAANKRAERHEEATTAVLEHVIENPGQSTNAIKKAIGEALGIDRTTIETALRQATSIHSQTGPRRAQLWYPGAAPLELTTTSLEPPPVKSPVTSSEVPNLAVDTTSLDGGSEGPLKGPSPAPVKCAETSEQTHDPAASEVEANGTPTGAELGRSGGFARALAYVTAHPDQAAGLLEAELLARGLPLGEVRELLELAAGSDFGDEAPPS